MSIALTASTFSGKVLFLPQDNKLLVLDTNTDKILFVDKNQKHNLAKGCTTNLKEISERINALVVRAKELYHNPQDKERLYLLANYHSFQILFLKYNAQIYASKWL